MNGNTSIDGDVNVSGILDAGVIDAELLYVSGYGLFSNRWFLESHTW